MLNQAFTDAMTARADAAIGELVDLGARQFLAEPWRVARLAPEAERLNVAGLRRLIARRGRPASLNAGLARAQLARALQAEDFGKIWFRWRTEWRIRNAQA